MTVVFEYSDSSIAKQASNGCIELAARDYGLIFGFAFKVQAQKVKYDQYDYGRTEFD